MDSSRTPRNTQKADVRPISLYLDNFGQLGDQVTLPIRPEDLTLTEPQRASVHQSLGRETQGWVDHFGAGLPQINVNGHTGWNYKPALGSDGFQSFEALNKLVTKDYPELRQRAIDEGRDPSQVKLLFVDLLDNLAYPVVPMQFVLRRSKSSPLLFRYNIVMQATDTSVDGGLAQFMPPGLNLTVGSNALESALGKLSSMIGAASQAVFSVLRPIANTVNGFLNVAMGVLRQTNNIVKGVNGFINSTAGFVIGIAKGISQVGREVFRTFSAIAGIPATVKNAFMQVGAAFNEVVCVFSNALKPRQTYDAYEGLYGASNCSSTTGGRMPSAFSNQNVFAVINPEAGQPVTLSGQAISSVNAINKGDAVLAPLPSAEIARHLGIINAGVQVAK